VRETEILVEQQPPQGVCVCDHAGLVINKFPPAEERGGTAAPKPPAPPPRVLPVRTTNPHDKTFLKQNNCPRIKATPRVMGRLLHRNVQRFRGGLVFKAHRLCVSLNSRLESNKEEEVMGPSSSACETLDSPHHTVEYAGFATPIF